MKRFDDIQYPHSELTSDIIAAAVVVHDALRPGHDEVIYERALCIEFAERSINFSQQTEYPILFKDRFLGKLIPDLIVEEKVIVDLKVVEAFNDSHISQMLGYLNITNLEVGLLLNFKHAKLQIKRVVNSHHRK
ncbi:MAG: GxxExxY protein [Luteolibacter sp.]